MRDIVGNIVVGLLLGLGILLGRNWAKKNHKNTIVGGVGGCVIGVGVAVVFIATALISGPIVSNVFTSTNPAFVVATTPTTESFVTYIGKGTLPAVDNRCLLWSEIALGVSSVMPKCVIGTVHRIDQGRIYFTDKPNSFFISADRVPFQYMDNTGKLLKLSVGDCIRVNGYIFITDSDNNVETYVSTSYLYECMQQTTCLVVKQEYPENVSHRNVPRCGGVEQHFNQNTQFDQVRSLVYPE